MTQNVGDLETKNPKKTNMQVFISSTLRDLEEYRKAAYDGIIAAGHKPFLMELLPAAAKSTQDVINDALASSDVHLALLGDQYGAIIPDKNVSWTEFETERALQLGKPGFVYIVRQIKGALPKNRLAETFKARVAESRIVKFVSSPRELRYSVDRDLAALDAEAEIESETASIILPAVELTDLKTLLEHPQELQKCSPRYFEELIADLLRSDGWDVELVARNNVPGPDIIAVSSRLGRGVPLKLIVECKKYSDTNLVDINVVRKVMYWVNEEYRATMGMIVTTSRFTKDAIKQARQYHEWRLDLRDQLAVLQWLKRQADAKDA